LRWNRFSGGKRNKSPPFTGGKGLKDQGERHKEKECQRLKAGGWRQKIEEIGIMEW